MTDDHPSFFARLFLAWVAYFKTIFDAEFAAGIVRLRSGAPALPAPAEVPAEKPVEKPAPLREATPDAALQLLAILQREGRLLDFLEEDIKTFSDAEVGAAARVVHAGCRKAIHEHFQIAAVREESEGARVTLPRGFDASEHRLTGNVVGEAPFTGTLQHRGWRVLEVRLPQIATGHKVQVLAPAEIEL